MLLCSWMSEIRTKRKKLSRLFLPKVSPTVSMKPWCLVSIASGAPRGSSGTKSAAQNALECCQSNF